MTATAQGQYKRQARLLKALAHPTRLRIVDELARGERCVSELTRIVCLDMPTVSRHLSLLKSSGILEDERRGSQVFYRLRESDEIMSLKCWRRASLVNDPDHPQAGRSV